MGLKDSHFNYQNFSQSDSTELNPYLLQALLDDA